MSTICKAKGKKKKPDVSTERLLIKLLPQGYIQVNNSDTTIYKGS